jgi:hypothetical protein
MIDLRDQNGLHGSRRPGASGLGILPGALQRGVDPLTGAVQEPGAHHCQVLAAFPEVQRLVQGQSAGFEPADHSGQFVTGLLVAGRRPGAGMRSAGMRSAGMRSAGIRGAGVVVWP